MVIMILDYAQSEATMPLLTIIGFTTKA